MVDTVVTDSFVGSAGTIVGHAISTGATWSGTAFSSPLLTGTGGVQGRVFGSSGHVTVTLPTEFTTAGSAIISVTVNAKATWSGSASGTLSLALSGTTFFNGVHFGYAATGVGPMYATTSMYVPWGAITVGDTVSVEFFTDGNITVRHNGTLYATGVSGAGTQTFAGVILSMESPTIYSGTDPAVFGVLGPMVATAKPAPPPFVPFWTNFASAHETP